MTQPQKKARLPSAGKPANRDSINAKVLGGEREGFGEGKGNLSPERFPFPSPSFPLRALHNGVKRGDGKGAAAAPPFKDDLGNVTLGEKFL